MGWLQIAPSDIFLMRIRERASAHEQEEDQVMPEKDIKDDLCETVCAFARPTTKCSQW